MNSNPEFTPEQLDAIRKTFTPEQMRAIREVIREDDKKAIGKSIDMSQPVIVPYTRHLAFPKVLYNHANCLPSRFVEKESIVAGGKPTKEPAPPYFETRTVRNQVELEAALTEGWQTDAPNFNAPKAVALPPSLLQPTSPSRPGRRGRPAKVEEPVAV